MDATTFFLTYPRADFGSHQRLYDFFATLGDVLYARIAREQHEDGGTHYHALVKYSRRLRGDIRRLDFDGHHPNIQSARSVRRVLEYISKEGDFEDYGAVPVVQDEGVFIW